jgi:hypothetical protein
VEYARSEDAWVPAQRDSSNCVKTGPAPKGPKQNQRKQKHAEKIGKKHLKHICWAWFFNPKLKNISALGFFCKLTDFGYAGVFPSVKRAQAGLTR